MIIELIESHLNTWYWGIGLMLVCSIIIAKACDVFDTSTNYLGRKMKDGVKGATLNAIGSSLPELLTTVFFLAFATHENLARDFAASIGGNTGSAIFNSIIIPMLVVLVVIAVSKKEVKFRKKVILRDGLFLIGAEVLLLVLLSTKYLTHWHGWAFVMFYLIYLFYTLFFSKKNKNKKKDFNDENPVAWYEKYQFKSGNNRVIRSWVLLTMSTLIIAIASAGLVEGCKGVADSLKVNPLFIALVLVAAASSVPDTIISIKDAKKGNYDDALSNVIGSNIFDITISMGLPLALFLIITGQKIDFTNVGSTVIDIRVMLILVTVVTMLIYYFSTVMTMKHVIFLGLLYSLFIIYVIGAADYYSGGDSIFAKFSGTFIEFLRQPDGIGDFLENIAGKITFI